MAVTCQRVTAGRYRIRLMTDSSAACHLEWTQARVAFMHVLILLPPSEGKTHPTGPPLDFNHLSRPELHPVRRKILTELDAVLTSPTRLRQMNLQRRPDERRV